MKHLIAHHIGTALVLSACSCLGQVLSGINTPENEHKRAEQADKSKVGISPLELAAQTSQAVTNSLRIDGTGINKLFFRPGEQAVVNIKLSNTGTRPETCELTCQTVCEINTAQSLFTRELSIAPGQSITSKHDFAIQGLSHGVEIRAALTQNARLVSERSDYFAVADNPLSLGQYLVVGTTRGRGATYRDKILPDIRSNYINTIEWYSWSPDTFGAFVPEQQFWRSAQSKYPEGVEGARTMIGAAHDHGISVLSYVRNCSVGPIGFDLARQHPEWVLYNVWGQFSGDGMGTRDAVKTLAYTSSGMVEVATVEWNFADPNPVKFGTQAWLTGAEFFGYDGVRFDGHYLATGPGSSSGSSLNAFGNDPNGGVNHAVLSERNQRMMKSIVATNRPGFLFGFNYGYAYDKTGAYAPGAFRVAAENSMIMWESAQGLARTGKSWADYVKCFKNEANIVLASKGYLFGIIIEGSQAFNGYAAALAIASRGHISSMKHMRPWYRFATRNAAFIYDARITEIPLPQQMVTVRSQGRVIYQPFVYRRKLSDKRDQLIVHLVNVPDDVIDKKAAHFPPPLSNISLSCDSQQLTANGKVFWTQAGEAEERWVELPSSMIDDRFDIKIPSLNLWGILVIEGESK